MVRRCGPGMAQGIRGSRENPADIGVAPWTGRNCAAWRRGASFALPRRAAGSALLACAWPAECSDLPRMNRLRAGRRRAVIHRHLTDLRCTCGGPSCTSRQGSDDGKRSRRPVTCAVLMTPPVSPGPKSTPRLNRPVQAGRWHGRTRAMITRIYKGTNQRVGDGRPTAVPGQIGLT